MRNLSAIVCFGAAVWLSAAWAAAQSPAVSRYAQLGFAKEKPAEGPSVAVDGGYLIPYKMKIPGSDVEFEMIPVPGGTFALGSPESEENRRDDEGPRVQVQVEPMWVAKSEITWAEYKLFMSMYRLFKSFEQQGMRKVTKENASKAITTPTELYEPDFTYEFGELPNMPAVTITQYAAKQYTKWLAAMTGHQYRLPTEAEWEFACRAGSKTAYSFGDDASHLGDYAWFSDNAEDKLHPVCSKKPNAWGLYDMHGSAMEWTIDGHTSEGYKELAVKAGPISFPDAIQWPKSLDKRIARGGGWQDDAESLRSASRVSSADMDWKESDPNIPKSPWWYTDDPARTVGFRLFRSYKPLDEKVITKFYEIDNDDIQLGVDIRLEEGRGVRGLVDPELADEIKKFLNQ